MFIFRLHRPAQDAFDTTGAFLTGGRWHRPSSRVIYAAQHVSLAVLETLVHADPGEMPPRSISRIFVPDACVVEFASWMELPESQDFGEAWIKERRSAVLAVPSIVVNKLESNFMLNPAHPGFAGITHEPSQDFVFDRRFHDRLHREFGFGIGRQ